MIKVGFGGVHELKGLFDLISGYARSDYIFSLYGVISSGIRATYVTHPVDMIKTRLQEDISRKQYGNMFSEIRDLYQKGGVLRR